MKQIAHFSRFINIYFYIVSLIIILICLYGFCQEKVNISFGRWNDLEEIFTKISVILTSDQAEITVEKVLIDNNHQPIVEIIANPVFEQENQDWDYLGQVQFIHDANTSFVQLGIYPSSNLIGENCIVQTLPSFESPHWVEIEYELHQEETLLVFDQLALVVLLDDTIIFLEPARALEESLIQHALFELSASERTDRELRICAGNWGDREQAGWVNIYRVSSQIAFLDPAEGLLISAKDRKLNVSYQFDGQWVSITERNQVQLSANQLSDSGEFRVTVAGEEPLTLRYQKFFPPSSPAQTDIISCVDHNQELFIVIEQNPNSSHLVGYYSWEVGCSAQDDFLWLNTDQLLNQTGLTMNRLPIELLNSQGISSLEHQHLFVDLELLFEQCGSNYSLSVRQCLPSGWCSSSIALNPTSCDLDLLNQVQFFNDEKINQKVQINDRNKF